MVEARLGGRYRLDDKLAIGGMGSVYAATDDRLGRSVAVKLLKDELSQDPRFIERFRREARAAGALSHPNVARIFDSGEDGARHFIVMELAEGRDLARLLREEGPLSPERTAEIAAQVADALAHAHAAGLVHRDVKPHNVIVDTDDHVKVTDFGIARAAGDSTLTATGSVLGTAQYISPEQASGTPIGPASDIYSLGIVLYEMLTGAVPFTGDSAISVAMRHVNTPVPAPSELNPDVPPEMDAIVAKATNKDPDARYADATEMAEALRAVWLGPTEELVGGDTAAMAPAAWPFPAHPPRWDPTRLGRAVLATFAVLVLVALALLAYRLVDAGERAREGRAVVILDDFRGRPFEEVRAELEGAGLRVTKVSSPQEGFGADIVWGHDPGPGAEATEGSTVTLFVATGEDPDEAGDEDEDTGEEEDKGKNEDRGKGKGKDKNKDEEDD
ncbi:MAG: protein kinase [Actinomycetota bacterium]|nr:protein kinase [Actinomycetota bacterium]